MSNSKSFKETYPDTTPLNKDGGQASTHVGAERGAETTKRLIKVLNRNKDPERRARMHREYTILKTLNHEAIPEVYDSNTEFFLDLDYKLYIAMEYIDGETLYDSLHNSGLFSLSEAVTFSLKLLDAIEFCHSNGIVHRDIKPDNIILRSKNRQAPVLVDFGLSFNIKDESSLTPDGHIIGNRFLFLPELGKNSVDKNDIRSDITMVVALLFYVLTGTEPGHLSDQKQALPHQRDLDEKHCISIKKINHIFDVGFQPSIAHRFQDAEALRTQLKFVLEPQAQPENTDDMLRAYLEKQLTAHNVEKLTDEQAIRTVGLELNNLFFKVQSALKGMVSLCQIKHSSSWSAYSFHEKFSQREMVCVKLEANILGNQIRIDGGNVELHGIYTGEKKNIHRANKDEYKCIDYGVVYEFLLGQVLQHLENSNNG